MARTDLPSTTNRAPGARPAPTFSTVEEAHIGLIERPAVSKPYRILYIAGVQDLEERAEHLQQVLGAVLDYVGAIVADTSHVALGGSIDRKYLLNLISDGLAMLPARSPMRRTTSWRGGVGDRRHGGGSNA